MRNPETRKMTNRQRLWEVAVDRFGYVTTQDAIDLGVPPHELPKLVEHGGLDHIAYGLYRFQQIPQTALDQYAEAAFRIGRDAYLTGETVLVLHNLIPLAPRRLSVGVDRRVRGKIPDWIDLRRETITENEITTYEGIRAKKVTKAILECKSFLMGARLIEATRVAREQGLITKKEEREVLNELAVLK